MLIFTGVILLIFGYCVLMWWLCGGRKMGKRIEAAARLRAQAIADYSAALNRQADAHEKESEAWHQATEAEKSATTAREREAKAAEKIAAELRAMDGDEQAEFFRRVFDRKKNPRGRHTAAPPGNQNFDRN